MGSTEPPVPEASEQSQHSWTASHHQPQLGAWPVHVLPLPGSCGAGHALGVAPSSRSPGSGLWALPCSYRVQGGRGAATLRVPCQAFSSSLGTRAPAWAARLFPSPYCTERHLWCKAASPPSREHAREPGLSCQAAQSPSGLLPGVLVANV